MLSRVAESIFWMCRYIERAENIARVVNVNWHLSLDDSSSSELQWQPLVAITGDEELYVERYGEMNQSDVFRFLALDKSYPNSIYSCLKQARENARSVREIIPSDLWEQVNTFQQKVHDAAGQRETVSHPHDFLEMVIKESNEFIGRTLTTMTHDDGWYFCRAGRMLERADKTSRILDVKYFYLLPSADDVGSPLDNVQWAALLRSVSALQAYRQRYGQIQPGNVVEWLLLSHEFPRSVRYCVESVQFAINKISSSPPGAYSNDAERYVDQLRSQLACARADEVILAGLHEFVDSLQLQLNHVGAAISETFFSTSRSNSLA
ncbi:MAG: hypothetical protein RLZZ303_2236 [Candidatus Hydrogenedentota bacterium]|jgi:uncharacterized alpha-E superfamily protein